jgi:glycosyltransferase involved in cell wall biosynthesis
VQQPARNGSSSVPESGLTEASAATDGVRISVVLTALNESQNLPHVLPRLPDGLHELVLVDGHCADESVASTCRLVPPVRVVRQTGRGRGNALACGLAAATGDIIVTLDADGSTDPAEIPRFVEALLAGADYAKGSRFLPGGGSEDITRLRAAGNSGLTRVVNVLFGTRYSDLCYGYNAFWSYLRDGLAEGVDGFEVQTAMTVRAAKAGLTVVEVPSMERPRRHGASRLKTFRDRRRVLKTIVRERFVRRTQEPDLRHVLHSRAVRTSRGTDESPSDRSQ